MWSKNGTFLPKLDQKPLVLVINMNDVSEISHDDRALFVTKGGNREYFPFGTKIGRFLLKTGLKILYSFLSESTLRIFFEILCDDRVL